MHGRRASHEFLRIQYVARCVYCTVVYEHEIVLTNAMECELIASDCRTYMIYLSDERIPRNLARMGSRAWPILIQTCLQTKRARKQRRGRQAQREVSGGS